MELYVILLRLAIPIKNIEKAPVEVGSEKVATSQNKKGTNKQCR